MRVENDHALLFVMCSCERTEFNEGRQVYFMRMIRIVLPDALDTG